jgi:hypothetical protein
MRAGIQCPLRRNGAIGGNRLSAKKDRHCPSRSVDWTPVCMATGVTERVWHACVPNDGSPEMPPQKLIPAPLSLPLPPLLPGANAGLISPSLRREAAAERPSSRALPGPWLRGGRGVRIFPGTDIKTPRRVATGRTTCPHRLARPPCGLCHHATGVFAPRERFCSRFRRASGPAYRCVGNILISVYFSGIWSDQPECGGNGSAQWKNISLRSRKLKTGYNSKSCLRALMTFP